MKISEYQQNILDTAITLLRKYDKEKYSGRSYFFTDKNYDNIYSDEKYDCCNEENCINEAIKKIEEDGYENPNINLRGGDYDTIDHCCICGCPLNSTLTWIKSELDHHEEYSITEDQLKESSIAFELRVMFESMPTCDYAISEYAKAHPELLPRELKKQSDFVDRVIRYAEKVIKILNDK